MKARRGLCVRYANPTFFRSGLHNRPPLESRNALVVFCLCFGLCFGLSVRHTRAGARQCIRADLLRDRSQVLSMQTTSSTAAAGTSTGVEAIGDEAQLPPPPSDGPASGSPSPAPPPKQSTKRKKMQLARATVGASERLAQLRAEAGLTPTSMPLNGDSSKSHGGQASKASAPHGATGKASDAAAAGPAAAPAAAPSEELMTQPKSFLECLKQLICGTMSVFLYAVLLMTITVYVTMRYMLSTDTAFDASVLLERVRQFSFASIGAWYALSVERMFNYAEQEPVIYLALNFGIAFLIGLFFLYLKDMTDWWEARQAAARAAEQQHGTRQGGYEQLVDLEAGQEECDDQNLRCGRCTAKKLTRTRIEAPSINASEAYVQITH